MKGEAHTRYIVVNLDNGEKRGFSYKGSAFNYAISVTNFSFIEHHNEGNDVELFKGLNGKMVWTN